MTSSASSTKSSPATPAVEWNDRAGYIAREIGQIEQFLGVVAGLVGLSVIIAVLGIANTLLLGVLERTREIGLLRAVGMSRRQVRTMVQAEGAILAALGALAGIGLGLLLAFVFGRAWRGQGFDTFAVPVQLLALVVAGAVATSACSRRRSRLAAPPAPMCSRPSASTSQRRAPGIDGAEVDRSPGLAVETRSARRRSSASRPHQLASGHGGGAVARIGLIGLAGAAGALARYAIGVALGGRLYPYGTLAINVIGSFLLGFVLGGPGASRWSETTTLVVGVGFLGAFTTFSTFTNETMDLLRDGRATAAFVYVFLSFALGLAAAAIGWTVGQDVT